ncbi:MAG: YIP1 family protein [Cyclobacteriaceae bacterium]|nr:YIP1 family protein [Cyclobacteriaceae bacterium]
MESSDNKNQEFDFGLFIEDSKKALLSPQEYFSNMSTSGGFVEPMIKAVIYGVVMGVFALIWSLLGMSFSAGWLGGGIGVMALVGSIIFAIVGLFIGGAIMLIISAILGGNTDYEANVRVVASLMVISVIQGVLGFFDGVNLYLSAIVSIAVGCYGLWMMYHALVQCLKAKEQGSKILALVLAVLLVITTFSGIAAKKMLHNFSDTYNLENLDNMNEEEILDNITDMIEEASGEEIDADELKEAMDAVEKVLEEVSEEGNEEAMEEAIKKAVKEAMEEAKEEQEEK